MVHKPKGFDAIAFKDEMQRQAEQTLRGLSPREQVRRTREELASGPLAAWWASLPRRTTAPTA